MSDSPAPNPLIASTAQPARFDAIRPEHVEPGVRQLLDELTSGLDQLEPSLTPSWEGLVDPLERLVQPMSHAWGAVGHLMGVKNSPELRSAQEAMQPEVVAAFTKLGQSRPIYEAAKSLRESDGWANLDDAQRRIVDKMILDAELSGVGLDGQARERFNEIQRELAECSTTFGNNVLDATKAFAMTLTAREEVEGLPASLLALSAQAARDAGEENATAEDGPWRITLDAPSYGPFLQHSKRRDLREEIYRAYVSRASSGDLDNSPLIERILQLRQEKAQLLGYQDYAEVSLAKKMAGSVAEVTGLLEDLRDKAWPAAQREHEELTEFARQNGGDEIRHWDVAYWAERQQEALFDFSDEDLRPYFPLPSVLKGLFDLASRLFGVTIESADGDAPVWHQDVRFFRIQRDGEPVAAFYLDPYSRPEEKRGGAWMDECLVRSRLFGDDGLRLPVAHLVCNGTPPVDDKPSLMTFREVETLFHEFGHGLQHMLTTVDFDGAAGINGVEWDAVELPSQFMENWCYHEPTVNQISGHWETGEPLPKDLFDKIVAARTFRSGSATVRQLYFGFTDLALHHGYTGDGETPTDVMRRIAERTTVLQPLEEDRFLCSFGHIFAGGYAAGYYSYKWAEVLSADAFGAFEDAGLDDEGAIQETGRRFRDTVLALGGSQHPMDVFKAFRGRGPSPDALLRHNGLT